MFNNRRGDEAYKDIVTRIKNQKLHIAVYGENQHNEECIIISCSLQKKDKIWQK